MGSDVIALDTVLSATFHFLAKWSPDLKRSQSRDLLRFLVCRLYDQSRGRLTTSEVTLAQGTLAQKLGLSRQWIGTLLARLQEAGWLEYHAPVLNDGMRGSTIFRVGNQLRRLLVMLSKAKVRKKAGKSAVKSAWQFSPSKEEKRLLQIRAKENELPSPYVIAKIPLLGKWLNRGTQSP